MNSTIEKFGFPNSIVREFDHWLLLVRPAQVTLGSMVLAAKANSTAYGELPVASFAEQGRIVAIAEPALTKFCAYERINYLMLMMVDPHVHFHIIPRYSSTRRWNGLEFPDSAWPGPPALGSAVQIETDHIKQLAGEISDLM